MKKNVLLDFNALISAHYNKLSKTGIYYVQYNIIKNLLNNYSNEFNFFAYAICGKKTFKNVVDTDYPEFKNIQYFNDLPLSQRILNYIRFQKQNLKRQKFKFFKKIFVKLYLIFLQIARLFIKLFFNKKEITIKNINIYQSFYDNIPDFILNNKKINKYIFVHDLIQITNPEYVSKDIKNTKKSFYNFVKNLINKAKIFTISKYVMNDIYKNFPEIKSEYLTLVQLASDKNKYFKIEKLDNRARLCSKISENGKPSYTLWFDVDAKYADYLTESADAFVVALLPYAMNNSLNISAEAKMSEQFCMFC